MPTDLVVVFKTTYAAILVEYDELSLPPEELARKRDVRVAARVKEIVDNLPQTLRAAADAGVHSPVLLRVEPFVMCSPYVDCTSCAVYEARRHLDDRVADGVKLALKDRPNLKVWEARFTYDNSRHASGYELRVSVTLDDAEAEAARQMVRADRRDYLEATTARTTST